MKPQAPVLLATNTFGRLGDEVNGVARTCQQLSRCFLDAGVPLEVVTYGDRSSVESDGALTVRTHRPDPAVKIDPALKIDPLFAFSPTAAAIARNRYLLVHSTTPDPLGIFAADLARRRGVPFVAGYHTAVDDYCRLRASAAAGRIAGSIAAAAMRVYLSHYYRRADLVLSPSRATADALRGWIRRPIRVLGRGVDSTLFHPARRNRSRSEPIRALYVGRVAVEKGLDALVPLLHRHPEISLTVVGDGPWLAEMRRRLPAARFTGTLRGEDLAVEYANADFFVFPSKTDTFGNVILEAMSSGLPAVVTDRGGPAEIVRDGVDGFIAPTPRAFEWAVLALSRDSALRERMARAARDAAERRSWNAIFGSLLQIYSEAMHLRVSRAPDTAPVRTAVVLPEAR